MQCQYNNGRKKSFSSNELIEVKINKEKFPKLHRKKESCLQTSMLLKIFNKTLSNTNNLLPRKDLKRNSKYYTSNLKTKDNTSTESSPNTSEKNIIDLSNSYIVNTKLNTFEKKEFSNDDIINIFETHYSKIKEDDNQTTFMEDCLILIKSLESFFISSTYENILKETMKKIIKIHPKLYTNIVTNSVEEKDILVLDMDETLLHVDFPLKSDCTYDFIDNSYSLNEIGICIRPGLQEFLNQISKYYDLILFSAGKRDYVEKVISTINIKNYFLMILCYDETINIVNEIYIKDLRLIYFIDYLRSNKSYFNRSEIQSVNFQNSNDLDCDCRSLNKIIEDFLKLDILNIKSNKISESELVKQKEVIIVDNNIYSFCINMDYGVLVEDFYNDKEDLELERLTQFLIDISNNKRNNGTRLNYQIKEIFNYNSLQ